MLEYRFVSVFKNDVQLYSDHTLFSSVRFISELLLEEHELICHAQHGFRPGKSCLCQLLLHIEEIIQNDLEGMETDVIYLNYAIAFEKVYHEILKSYLGSELVGSP